jgi:hypothetical protein
VAPGWYKTIRSLTKQIREANAGSDQQKNLQDELERRTQSNAALAEGYLNHCQSLVSLYSHPTTSNPIFLSPPALRFPSSPQPSIEIYQRIVALALPISQWPESAPESKTIRDAVLRQIHPDHVAKLALYLDRDQKSALTACFLSSAQLLDDMLKRGDHREIAEWKQSWHRVKFDIQQAILPSSSSSTPVFVFGHVLDDAYQITLQSD